MFETCKERLSTTAFLSPQNHLYAAELRASKASKAIYTSDGALDFRQDWVSCGSPAHPLERGKVKETRRESTTCLIWTTLSTAAPSPLSSIRENIERLDDSDSAERGMRRERERQGDKEYLLDVDGEQHQGKAHGAQLHGAPAVWDPVNAGAERRREAGQGLAVGGGEAADSRAEARAELGGAGDAQAEEALHHLRGGTIYSP
jgi:hypothetical protein